MFNFCLTNAVLPCIIKENLPVRGGNTRVTFEDLQELLAEQFSCDTSELERGVTLADLGADHEDMVELAWGLGEAVTFTLPAANDKSLSLLKRTGSFVHVCVRG